MSGERRPGSEGRVSYSVEIEKLGAALPSVRIDSAPAVLGLVFSSAADLAAPIVPERPEACPNCDTPTNSERSPYCGGGCRDQAAFVRQVRAAANSGAIWDPDRQIALGQVLWSLLGGGYPARLLDVPERSRKLVLARTDGACELCKAPATTIDHIRTACNRPINLRPVCEGCRRTREFGDPVVLSSGGPILEALSARVLALTAIRCCDDPDLWDWRAFLKRRFATRPK